MSNDFKIWWHNEGSGMPPFKDEETCDHVERVSAIAWSNGAFKATLSLEAENARLKAEVERLTAEKDQAECDYDNCQKRLVRIDDCRCDLFMENKTLKAEVERLRASSFVTAVPVEQYERLRKAGDAMADAIDIYRGWIRLPGDEPLREAFNRVIEAMKEGKPSV